MANTKPFCWLMTLLFLSPVVCSLKYVEVGWGHVCAHVTTLAAADGERADEGVRRGLESPWWELGIASARAVCALTRKHSSPRVFS